MPNSLEINFTSSPLIICLKEKVRAALPATSPQSCISGTVLWRASKTQLAPRCPNPPRSSSRKRCRRAETARGGGRGRACTSRRESPPPRAKGFHRGSARERDALSNFQMNLIFGFTYQNLTTYIHHKQQQGIIITYRKKSRAEIIRL